MPYIDEFGIQDGTPEGNATLYAELRKLTSSSDRIELAWRADIPTDLIGVVRLKKIYQSQKTIDEFLAHIVMPNDLTLGGWVSDVRTNERTNPKEG